MKQNPLETVWCKIIIFFGGNQGLDSTKLHKILGATHSYTFIIKKKLVEQGILMQIPSRNGRERAHQLTTKGKEVCKALNYLKETMNGMEFDNV